MKLFRFDSDPLILEEYIIVGIGLFVSWWLFTDRLFVYIPLGILIGLIPFLARVEINEH